MPNLRAELAELEARRPKAPQTWQQDKIARRVHRDPRANWPSCRDQIEHIPRAHAQLAADFRWGKDLGGSDETIISLMHDRPVFVTHYPREAKAFYMKRDRGPAARSSKTSTCWPPTASARSSAARSARTTTTRLLARIHEQGYNPEHYDGTWTCVSMARSRTAASAWASNEPWPGLPAKSTSASAIAFPRMMDKVYI